METSGSYSLEHDERLELVRVTVRGQVPRELGEEIITRARQLAESHDADLLYDMTGAIILVPFVRWFLMPRELGVLTEPRARDRRAAIVASRRQVDEYVFYETTASNVGLSVRVFLETAEALAWLAAGERGGSAPRLPDPLGE